MRVKLSKPLVYCDETYTELDIKLELMRFKDKREVMRQLRDDGIHDVLKPEMDERYLMAVAARMSGVPIEALNELLIPDSEKVEQAVQSFLLGMVPEEKKQTES